MAQRLEGGENCGMGDAVFELLATASSSADPRDLLKDVLSSLLASIHAEYMAVVRGQQGRWTTLAAAGLNGTFPEHLVGETLDTTEACRQGAWVSAMLDPRASRGELLVVRARRNVTRDQTETVQRLASLLGRALATVRHRQQLQHRIDRLETVLEITGQWNQTQSTDDLLNQIAKASTQLLAAERASIFLWDKKNQTLVGRPALGIEEGELRVPDDAGVVGQVVNTGECRRVDEQQAEDEVDRSVDRQLGFRTRNLLCVPLRSAAGKMLGAFELINKVGGNFTEDDETALGELAAHAAVALENSQQYEQLLRVQDQIADQAASDVQLIGECPAIEALQSTVRRIADTDLALLILGENGTGKEVVARLIHYLSTRKKQPLVAVNCAALSETLLESELFGHERGAFTDAVETRVGKFELASGGTLFLDEIGDMSPGGQSKLLRVLEEKIVVRVGGSTPIHTDARVIAATNQNLARMVREKEFREDLFFRLNVVTLELPPLRERGDDVLLLADHFLEGFCVAARRKVPRFTAAARKRLLGHAWPGNVRELRNLMERLAYLTQDDKIDADDLAFIMAPDRQSPPLLSMELPLTEATREFQAEYIRSHIERAHGSMTEAAKRLGLHRSNLYRKMRQLKMNPDDEPGE
jgi:Nif-specific regulatory protein